MMVSTYQNKLNKILDWKKNKPQTNSQWAEDVKEESLHLKYNYQLKEMEKFHESKIPKVQKELDKFNDWPDAVRYELTKQFSQIFEEQGNPNKIEGKTLQEWVDEEFQSQFTYYQWKKAKLEQSVERIKKERELRASGYLVPDKDDNKKPVNVSGIPKERIRKIKGTTYYVDFDNGNDTNAGTSTGAAWATLDQFTENARSAGDICIVRGGMTQTVTSDLTFTSDGTIDNPIIIKRDYGDEWGDHVDISGTATATFTFGSKTVIFSADVSSVISAGDWIYNSDDDSADEFAYEVASVSTTTVTLYLPFKGTAGSGKTVINMGSNPIWNTAAGDYQWNFDTDSYWKLQGLHIRGTDANGQIELDTCYGHLFKDCVLDVNGASDIGILLADTAPIVRIYKCRSYNNYYGVRVSGTDYASNIWIKDFYAKYTTNASGYGLYLNYAGYAFVEETGIDTYNYGLNATGIGNRCWIRNIKGTNIGTRLVNGTSIYGGEIGLQVEDYDNSIGDTRFFGSLVDNSGDVLYQSDTTTVRSGGSNKSIKVIPSTKINSVWEHSRVKIFEIPFYATTASKTYTDYFKPDDTTEWTDDPTADELWIELEAWGHASNNFRKITKSTGTIDMNGNSGWQSLSVTVAPAQSGVAYLRCYYAKTKETGKNNIFYVDPIPVIS